MLTSDKIIVQQILDQCQIHGVKHIVISPGSRNAPFSIAFDEHPDFETYIVHDERSAAFFALGIADETQVPVALCCTSGSAAFNYAPAIAEAYYRSVPLIVITSDRPAAWINQGDGQTIMQKNIFGGHVRASYEFDDQHYTDDDLWKNEREIASAFNMGLGKWKGPIHFNVGLNEPLYNVIEKTNSYSRKITLIPNGISWNQETIHYIKETLSQQKVMLLCGQLPKNEILQQLIIKFAANSNCAVLVENTSNLQSTEFNPCIDRSLNAINSKEESAFIPDVLITIGGAIVSKRIKNFIRRNKIKTHWKIGSEFPEMDTYQCLTHHFDVAPLLFFKEIDSYDYQRNQINYAGKWKKIDIQSKDATALFESKNQKPTDINVFQALHENLTQGIVLHMSNSSVVRYCQLFDPIAGIDYRANRGTSGIDGSTSTAMGSALISPKKQHLLISGDISFLYDSNALWNQNTISNLKIIVINNGGGGIFRIIDGPSNTKQLNKYFEAEHQQSVAHLANGFGWDYEVISEKTDMSECLSKFLLRKEGKSILEIVTDQEMNAQDLQHFFDSIKTNITHGIS